MRDNRDPQMVGVRLLAQLAMLRRRDPAATASMAADQLPGPDTPTGPPAAPSKPGAA